MKKELPYTDYSTYLNRLFPGVKMQKISVNASLGCPNRDGTISSGGCIYCDNSSFSPAYCMKRDSISEQLEAGKSFFRRKYPDMRYLAYFQSFTNTYGDTDTLMSLYREAASVEGVDGIIIGTRPDCLAADLPQRLSELDRECRVMMEYGVESVSDSTLAAINRGHTFADTRDAISRTIDAGLHVGVHLIAGLPGEDDDDVLRSVETVCSLGISSLKLHQMQVIRGTELARRHAAGNAGIKLYTADEYLKLCARIVGIVPRSVAIERFVSQAPDHMLIAPRWGLRNYEFTHRLHRLLAE